MPRSSRLATAVVAATLLAAPVAAAAPAAAAVSPYGSCADVAAALPDAVDGTYTLTVQGRTFDVHCADLASAPVEYLTLPAGDATNVGQTVADWENFPGETITTRYARLRLTLPTSAGEPATVDATDRRFATSTGRIGESTAADWATGSACNYPWGSLQYGQGSADLRGTPFGVDARSFAVSGWMQDGTVTQPTPQRVVTRGNGWCGGAGPTTPTAVPLTWAAPEVTTDPVDTAVASGADATFTVAVRGLVPVTVRWEVSDDADAPWDVVPDATGTTLTLPAVTTAQDGRRFRAVLTSTAGTVTSAAATLTVGPGAPVVTGAPADVSVASGGDAVFTVGAGGDPAPGVRWQVSADGGASWADLDGEDGTTLTLAGVTTAADGLLVRAVLTSAGGTVETGPATLSVAPALPTVAAPVDVRVDEAGRAVFAVDVTGDPEPAVRWQRSADDGATWQDVAGAVTDVLVLDPVGPADDDALVRAVATNAAGSVVSAPARLEVVAAPAPVATPTPVAVASPAPAPGETAAPATGADGAVRGTLAATGATAPWFVVLAAALLLVVAGTAVAARATRLD
ncbi:GON domain-containing protein [Cellulomonas sp.]|uniref:GON domain-containing protein n=1 Tax=Cellulomonas sp. TaxID=40001 RepID=UPI0028127A42|nr:GON domain-containing protein [Cellulomonas sp.]